MMMKLNKDLRSLFIFTILYSVDSPEQIFVKIFVLLYLHLNFCTKIFFVIIYVCRYLKTIFVYKSN